MKAPPQIDKLLMPFSGYIEKGSEMQNWLDFVLEFTKRTEAGKWNDKYGIMTFKANYGYHSAMKKIVDDCVREMKKETPDVVVLDETDDDRVRTWVVGKPDKIKEMIEDELRAPFATP
jgi:hypothetical protein